MVFIINTQKQWCTETMRFKKRYDGFVPIGVDYVYFSFPNVIWIFSDLLCQQVDGGSLGRITMTLITHGGMDSRQPYNL